MQPDAPDVFEYVPAMHGVQALALEAPDENEYVPALQGEHTEADEPENVPAPQDTHE